MILKLILQIFSQIYQFILGLIPPINFDTTPIQSAVDWLEGAIETIDIFVPVSTISTIFGLLILMFSAKILWNVFCFFFPFFKKPSNNANSLTT